MGCQEIWSSHSVTLSAPGEFSFQETIEGTACSLVSNACVVELEPGKGPLSLTQVVAIRIPIQISESQMLYGYMNDMNWGFTKSVDCRILIVVDFAGTTKTFEVGYGEAISGALRVERVFSPQGVDAAGQNVIGTTSQRLTDYYATVMITVTRRSLDDAVNVGLDGVDILAYPI